MSNSQRKISQEDYDEAIRENQDIFDLSMEDVVEETNDQFKKMLNLPDDATFGTASAAAYLSLTHPDSERGKFERNAIQDFTDLLDGLDKFVHPDGSVSFVDAGGTGGEETSSRKAISDIERIVSLCTKGSECGDSVKISLAPKTYISLLLKANAIYTLMSLLGATTTDGECANEVAQVAANCLTILTSRSIELRTLFAAFESAVGLIASKTECLSQAFDANDNLALERELKFLHDMTLLIVAVCRGSENNKVKFVRTKGSINSIISCIKALFVVMESTKAGQQIDLAEKACESSCKCVVVLCRYEDNKDAGPSIGGMAVSSSHDHAQEFYRSGAVQILTKVTRYSQSKESLSLASASMAATRVLAINDEIVQAFVAGGALETTRLALSMYGENLTLVSVALGVVRNICGNDEIKTTLTGDGTLQQVLICMRKHLNVSTIQEHGCGTLAAMALRKASNACTIATLDGVRDIMNAMRKHESNILVQRQGSLACRNIISRSPQLRDTFMDLGSEDVLRKAGRFQGSVDEAYAALRDLGCQVGMSKFDETGKQVKLQMFGETKPVFNPSFEESKDTQDRITSKANLSS